MCNVKLKLLDCLEELEKKIKLLEWQVNEWTYFLDHEEAAPFQKQLEVAQRKATCIKVKIRILDLQSNLDKQHDLCDLLDGNVVVETDNLKCWEAQKQLDNLERMLKIEKLTLQMTLETSSQKQAMLLEQIESLIAANEKHLKRIPHGDNCTEEVYSFLNNKGEELC